MFSTLQFSMRHKSSIVCVEIPLFFLNLSIVELLILYLFIKVYVLSLLFFNVSQNGSYVIIYITNFNDRL